MNGARVMVNALVVASSLLACGLAIAQPRTAAAVSNEAAIPVTEPAAMAEWLRRLVGRYTFDGSVEVVYYHEGEGYEEHRCAPLPPPPSESGELPPPATPYCSTIQGKGDCIGIGKGPGVQCILDVSWQDIHEVILLGEDQSNAEAGIYNLPGGVSNLSPAMALFGLDPASSAINYLLVDQKGLPEGGSGSIRGNRATFKTTCVNGAELFARMKPPPSPPDPTRPEGPPRTCDRILRLEAKPEANLMHWSMDIEINGEPWTRYEMTLRRSAQDVAAVPQAQR